MLGLGLKNTPRMVFSYTEGTVNFPVPLQRGQIISPSLSALSSEGASSAFNRPVPLQRAHWISFGLLGNKAACVVPPQ